MDVDEGRALVPDVEGADGPTSQDDAPLAAEMSDSSASKERTERPAESSSPDATPAATPVEMLEATPPETPEATPEATPPEMLEATPVRPLEELAVTVPLKAISATGVEAFGDEKSASGDAEPDERDEPDIDPLTPGAALAGYTIERLLREEPEGPVYLATPPAPSAPDGATDEAAKASEPNQPPPDDEPPPWRYIVREVTESDAERLEHVVAAEMRGPGLLAPVSVARAAGRAFLIGVELPGSGEQADQPAPALSPGERLRPVDALVACAQLATALAALHRAGLAHLRVSPDRVALYDGRVYLSGVEGATPVTDPEEAQALYARDANFLARTIGTLGGAGDVTLWDHDSSAQRSLREIATRGEAGSFTSADEVAEASSLALQTLMVAGARMGADIRAVRLRISSGAATSVGRVRSENQDAWAAAVFNIRDDAAADAPLGVFLVADGMGGEAHGEVASRLVARIVAAEMARRFLEPQMAWPAIAIFTAAADDAQSAPQTPLAQALEQAVKEANRRTRAFGAKLNATTGSTVTALAVSGARAALAHLGDSRAYLLRDGQLIQLTEDHSLIARMQAMNHPLLEDPSFMAPRSVLYRSVGQEDDATPDMLQFVLAPGDRIVLCSDGLWDEVPPERVGQAMGEATDPGSCASELVALANAGGGHDNSTAVAVFVEAEVADTPFDDVELDRAGAAEGMSEVASGQEEGQPDGEAAHTGTDAS